MNTDRVLLVIADQLQSMKAFKANFRSRSRLPKSARLVFSDSESALSTVETEIARGARICGGFLDFPAGAVPARKALAARYREIVRLGADASWLVTHDRGLDVFSEATKIFGAGTERKWDTLVRPFSRDELLHKALRVIQCGPGNGCYSDQTPGSERNALLAARSERLVLLGQLSRGIGHEFGNILLKISGRAELAMAEESLDRAKVHLEILSAAAERAGLIVRNLQSLSRTGIRPEPVAGSAILEEALLQSLHATANRSIEVVKRYAAVPKALADKRAITQVFTNLVLNAIEAMPKGGRLELRIAREVLAGTPMVAISVADTGAGIPPDVLPRIFEFAFTTKGDMGTGLGLSISKQVVEAHGGEIRVETSPGKGTRVTVSLPVGTTD